MPEYNVNKKKLEISFAWAQFYQNSPNLAVPVLENTTAFIKIQKEIALLQKEMFSLGNR